MQYEFALVKENMLTPKRYKNKENLVGFWEEKLELNSYFYLKNCQKKLKDFQNIDLFSYFKNPELADIFFYNLQCNIYIY